MSDLNDQIAAKWINRLPLRWAIGGLLVGVVWSAISSYLQGRFKDPAGGVEAGLVRLIVFIVLPLGGGVCISRVTYDQMRKILPLAFTDLGAQDVKNIQEPVRWLP
ncbi:hypothetical protein ACH79_20545 [Bradyrhizobium sp. CCBAU 051011]|uniref:hypothetical protein n=1 Tax=Bradyrhizobium sp. CCBAU 051011 TaxID=858422 RepID=UPI001373F18F|nr:hypothetical protein [Bradyrhizobium sp. CCBAU 051011]QHO74666.1 hypothetical protein ACH79_20545 [Bradyrhizobium sp. CCBAU 051011]